MANRAALRSLQDRLASRLQAARTEGTSASWLAVRVHEKNYLIPLAQAGEIFPLARIQRVPYCQPWFMGVINLRGALLGVVDLARFMGENRAPATTGPSLTEFSVVTFNPALELNAALMVDALLGLRQADAFAAELPPPAGAPPYLGRLLADPSGQSWQEIHLQHLSQLPAFLQISVSAAEPS